MRLPPDDNPIWAQQKELERQKIRAMPPRERRKVRLLNFFGAIGRFIGGLLEFDDKIHGRGPLP